MKEFKAFSSLLSSVRRCSQNYEMIEEGDRIAVGVSGGKDSLALLVGMSELRRFYPIPFTLSAITEDMGFEGADYSAIAELCREINVEYRVERTDIARIIFEERKEPNPCSLCARMRRGVLHAAAKEMGCTTIALGHHFDDAVETFMLNLFFEGRLGCFSPVTYLSNRDLYMIRPLLYAKEKDVEYFARHNPLPITASLCPEDKHTERENMKQLLRTLERENPGLRHRLFHAMCEGRIDGFRPAGRLPD